MIYLDNAATTFPKPANVARAVSDYITKIGGSPGRSGHRLSLEAAELVFSARTALAGLFRVDNPMRVILCSNATEALNLAVQGSAVPGCHAVTSSMEHNSTIRILSELQKKQVLDLTIVSGREGAAVTPDMVEARMTPRTRFLVINHGSNAFGTVQPLSGLGELCRRKGVLFIVDAAQTAGTIDIDMKRDGIDLLAFSGHKGLYGPTGTGGLVLADDFDPAGLSPLKYGGTGSYSDRIEQPEFLPDKYECGTLNAAGFAGLVEGVRFVLEDLGGTAGAYQHKKKLASFFLEEAGRIPGFTAYVEPAKIETGTVSFNIGGMDPAFLAGTLSEKYDIMCRPGLHCAPLAHRSMGTFPRGTVRFSFGAFNTEEEVRVAVDALHAVRGNGTV